MDKKIKRKAYFVNAAIKILKSEGLTALTARNIAKETGYNVASIYTYFENLDHLENLASIYFTNDYSQELTDKTSTMKNPFMVYLAMWEIFTVHALAQPDYFYNVFYCAISQTANLNLFKEYYTIFPNERPSGGLISGMIEINHIQDRENFILEQCAQYGAIFADKIDYIGDIHNNYFKCILTDIVKSALYPPSPALYRKCMRNFLYSMQHYVADSYKNIISEMLNFYHKDCCNYDHFFKQQ